MTTKVNNRMIDGDTVNCQDYGILPDGNDHTAAWLNLVDVIQPARIYMPEGTYQLELFKVKANSEVYGDGVNRTIVELTHTGTHSVVMGQINSNTYVHDIAVKSLMPDLALQRCSLENASHVTLERMTFSGFRDVTGPADAWGLLLANTEHVRILQCGFTDNSQSDIAMTDVVKNINIDGCYAITNAFHVNIEPNSSAAGNQGISVSNSKLSRLSLLENGAGGTGAGQITIKNCEVDIMKYDGSHATLIDCRINDFEAETALFTGNLRLVNTMGLTPSLIDDPYFCNFGFSQAQAVTDNNGWYMKNRTGSIGGDQLDPGDEDGIRFTRVNPNKVGDGIVNFSLTNPLNVTAGEVYAVILTGRYNAPDTSARYLTVSVNGVDRDAFSFRQSNGVDDPWSTEMIFIPVTVTGTLDLKVGTFTNGETVDVASISVHRVDKQGSNAQRMIDDIHENTGRREFPVLGQPVSSDANVRSLQDGDIMTQGANTWIWNGGVSVPI